MTQAEKRDLILQYLYSRKHERMINLQLKAIMNQLNIYESDAEVSRMAEALTRDKLAIIHKLSGGRDHVHSITPEGIDYCEGDSFSQPGTPVTSLHITVNGGLHSTNAVLGSNISHVHQTATITHEAEDLVHRIREGINAASLSREEKEDISECLDDIKHKLESGKKVPNLQWGALVNSTANIATAGSFALQLAQLFGFAPPMPTP